MTEYADLLMTELSWEKSRVREDLSLLSTVAGQLVGLLYSVPTLKCVSYTPPFY